MEFQEALNSIIRKFYDINDYEDCNIDEETDTLQELIDNYEKLETKCFDLEQELECIYDDPKQKLEECVTDLDIKNQKLEKALDIVCESYEWEDKPPKPYKSWKEWALKESEKQ